MKIRTLVTFVEDTLSEQDVVLNAPLRRAVAMAVIENPFAGRYAGDLSELIAMGEELGDLLPRRALAALGPDARAESFGKAAIVGTDGELEHAGALLHPKLGAPFRAVLGGGPALIPSAKKRGRAGTAIDIPLGHKDDAYVRSHFDAIEAHIPDAPRGNEILIAVAVTDGSRPLPRIGGKSTAEL
ncbi:amino acid synthesis family protein [Pseudooceanicola sp. CBS1P-1]|uniref:Amino acid synthesis family protein n=1 Tax=Pseudooceanicola albus TaxID=2692189 RepID=A0A6L7G7N5_9RHOB|nr:MULTISPECIES: amino acid synthesis family protein [Pseudooceanicola]MBT9384323.1 amino acid synthesis family protein [Pseudooceanicola endophyticus]MXN19939.1 amino acid synthesis family protein [Pseudooceanicola albus]